MSPEPYPSLRQSVFVCVCVRARSLTLDGKCSSKRSTAIKQESERDGEREADEQEPGK